MCMADWQLAGCTLRTSPVELPTPDAAVQLPPAACCKQLGWLSLAGCGSCSCSCSPLLPPPASLARFPDCDDAPVGSQPAPAQHPAHRQQLHASPAAHAAAAPHPQRQAASPLVWVLAAFTLLLLAVGLRDNPSLRRFVRRQLGLRIL